jgi:Flp pilus assembly secretin CpaC
MTMFDAFHGTRPKKRVRMASVAAGALMIASFGAAVPALRSVRQDTGSALVDVLVSGRHQKENRSVVENSQAVLEFSKDMAERIAIGNEEILKAQPLTKRKLMLTALKIGRTSITVWFADGATEQYMFSVGRDLSVLEQAVKNIHPSIEAEIAPDRDAVVLSGTVPEASYSTRAEEAAQRYISAGAKGDAKGAGQIINLIRVQNPGASIEARMKNEVERMGGKRVNVRRVMQGSEPNDDTDTFVIEGSVRDDATLKQLKALAARVLPGSGKDKESRVVTSLVETSDRPTEIEEIMESAIHDLGYTNVKVHKASLPGDPSNSPLAPRGEGNPNEVSGKSGAEGAEIFVLTGSVPTQTALTRTLTLASRLFSQKELVRKQRDGQFKRTHEVDINGTTRTVDEPLKLTDMVQDVKVIANESGGLKTRDANAFGGGSGSGIQSVLSAAGGNIGGGSGAARLLYNQLDSNIGRAKALEIADGRIVSFLTVENLPQIRVDIRLVEVNRTALLTWNINHRSQFTNFDLPSSLRPSTTVINPVTGQIEQLPNNTPQSNTDVSGIVSFLSGALGGQFAASGGPIDVKAVFDLLESEGLSRTLTNPSLTVLSGELAFFGVGGTVPVETSLTTSFGNGIPATGATSGILTGTVERDFGVRLSVRPLVDEDGFITIDVVPSVSNPDADLTKAIRDATGTPPTTVAFQERSMRTSSRLRDGQTLLIAGLTQHARADTSSQAPWINRVPLLGALFKGFSYSDEDRELVIVVCPVIVRDVPKEAPLWAYPDSYELLGATRAACEKAAAERAAADKAEEEEATTKSAGTSTTPVSDSGDGKASK